MLIMPAIVVAVLAAVLMQFLHWRASLHMLSGQQSDCLSVCQSVCLSSFADRLHVRHSVSQYVHLAVCPFGCCFLAVNALIFQLNDYALCFMSSINDTLG